MKDSPLLTVLIPVLAAVGGALVKWLLDRYLPSRKLDVTQSTEQQAPQLGDAGRFVDKAPPGPAGEIDKAESRFVQRVIASLSKALDRGRLRYRRLRDAVVIPIESTKSQRRFLMGARVSPEKRALLFFIGTRRWAKKDRVAELIAKSNEFNRRLVVGRVYVDDDGELMVDYALSLRAADVPRDMSDYVGRIAGVADEAVDETQDLTTEEPPST
jgi:hypothetical protein